MPAVRRAMASRGIQELPLYPEARECTAPSAARILEIFGSLWGRACHLPAASCGLPSVRAEWLEDLVWTTLVSLLRQPGILVARLEAFRTQPGVREVGVLSEVEHLRRQLYCLWSVKPVGRGRNAVAP